MAWIVWTGIGYLSVYSILYPCLSCPILYVSVPYRTLHYSPFLPSTIPYLVYTWHIGILTDTVAFSRTTTQPNQAKPSPAHDTKIDIPTAPKSNPNPNPSP